MKKLVVSILSLALASFVSAQSVVISKAGPDYEIIQKLIGKTEAEIVDAFGSPEEVGTDESKSAVVWTYVMQSPNEDTQESRVIGYRQIAFWNGLVASASTRWFMAEEEAEAIYSSALDHMAEGGRTVAPGGNFDPEIFTANVRISRRADNLWMVDMLQDELNSHATLLVGDAGYHMCRESMELEAERIEAKFGLDVTSSSETTEN